MVVTERDGKRANQWVEREYSGSTVISGLDVLDGNNLLIARATIYDDANSLKTMNSLSVRAQNIQFRIEGLKV